MHVFLGNARARNTHVEATLNHPFPAQAAAELARRVAVDEVTRRKVARLERDLADARAEGDADDNALRKDAAPANAAAPAPPSSSSSARVAVDVEAPPPTRSPPPVVEAYRSSPRPAAVVLRSGAARGPAAIGARPAKKRRSFSLKTTLLVAYVLALHSLVFFSFSHCHDIETYLDLEEAA